MDRNGEITLELFGRPTIATSVSTIALSPMQWALVSVIYGAGAARVTREEAVELLWEGQDPSTTRRRLSQLIYEVEQRTPCGLFLKSGYALRPNPELVKCDLEGFGHHLAQDEVGAAARLLARGFLRGLPAVPTASFDRWIDSRLATLRAAVRKQATRRWTRAENESLWNERTRDAAEALLFLDPSGEDALRKAIWAQAMNGDPLGALATVQGFVEMNGLTDVEALEESSRDLIGRVQALTRHRGGRHFERPLPSKADPTLFGREQELADLRRLIAGPVVQGLKVVAVSGGGGLGKSRLIRECLEPAMLQGRLILHAQLAELERDIPLSALIEAMDVQDVARALMGLTEPWRSVLLSLMPSFANAVGPPLELPYVQPDSLQRRLLESVRHLVNGIVTERPVLLFIDDFHWADESSLAALEYIRRRWSEGSLVLVVAHRPEHVPANSPVASFLEADSVHRVELGPIGNVAQIQLVKEASGGEVPESVVNSLKELGGGNPLFLIELARQWSEGELNLPTRSVEAIRLPVSIKQLFRKRLAGFGDCASRVLETLAVLGKRASMNVVREVSGLTETEVTSGLEVLETAGLLRWSTDGVELWHELVRQAVLGGTSEARLRSLHGQVGRYLTRVDRAGLADEIALHFDRACLRSEAFEYGLAAAQHSEMVGALPEAILHLAICDRNAPSDRVVEIRRRRARVHHLQCDHSTALKIVDSEEVRAADLPTRDRLAIEALRWDCWAQLSKEDPATLLESNQLLRERARLSSHWEIVAQLLASAFHYGQRVGVLDTRPLLTEVDGCTRAPNSRAQSIAHGVSVWWRSHGEVLKSRWHGEEAVRIAKLRGQTDLLARAFNVLLVLMYLDGELGSPRGESMQREALASAKESGDLLGHLRLLSNVGAFYLDIGELARAEVLLDEAMRVRLAADVEPEGSRCLMNRGELSLALRDPESAESLFEGALPEKSGGEWLGWSSALAGIGLCRLALGDLGTARSLADRLRDSPEEPLRFPVDATLIARLRSRVCYLGGHLEEGAEILSQAEQDIGSWNAPGFLKVRLDRARMASRNGQPFALLAEEGLAEASRLNLSRRVGQFEELLAR